MDPARGTVYSVGDDTIKVMIMQNSACSGCHARGFCSSLNQRERLVEVKNFPAGLSVGDPVILFAEDGVAMKAVILAFILPLVFTVSGALILSRYGINDLWIALILMGLLILYGCILFLSRNSIESGLVLWAERDEKV